MDIKNKMTAHNTPAGTGEEQSLQNNCKNSITNNAYAVNTNRLETISMTELYDTAYKPKTALIEEFLYSGLYMFVGAPKTGKSFAMEQIGYHISKGIELWGRKVRQGSVLYLALEDNHERIQSRLYKMFGEDASSNYYFSVKSEMISKGLEGQLEQFINEHNDVSLIIIDTLQKVRELHTDSFSYAKDYDIIASLKKFADDKNICIVLVHHTRKQESSDAFDGISGTNGLFGAADGAFVLHKDKRTEKTAILEISGRDIPEQRLHLKKSDNCVWELIKSEVDSFEEPTDEVIEIVASFINKNGGKWSGLAAEFANCISVDIQSNQLTRKLNCNVSLLNSKYKINYANKRKKDGVYLSFHLQN